MVWQRIVVGDQERILITKNGRFGGILSPGEYRMFVALGDELATEKYNLANIVFDSTWSDYLVMQRPELVDRYFTRVETNDVQIALVYVDARLYSVLTPAKRVLYWRDAGNVTAEVIDVIADPEIPTEKLPASERVGRSLTIFSVVEDAKTGLLLLGNRLLRTLPPRECGFWASIGAPAVEMGDLRRILEVPGHTAKRSRLKARPLFLKN